MIVDYLSFPAAPGGPHCLSCTVLTTCCAASLITLEYTHPFASALQLIMPAAVASSDGGPATSIRFWASERLGSLSRDAAAAASSH